MNILIVGNGGREHALAWKVAQSEQVEQIFVAPGNAGTELEQKTTNIAIDPLEIEQLIDFCKQNGVDLTIVGPEAPLAAGIVDKFQQAGLPCFGPTQKAAQLESSKAFSKDFMHKYNIPTANYETFTDLTEALAYLDTQNFPLVIKADGLAAGKGVIIAQDKQQAIETCKDILHDNRFGDAGSKIVVEEFLHGEEASFIVMVDGKNILPLATSQDHKARDDGDKGPNTGGMGAYSPAPVVTDEIFNHVMQDIVNPTVAGLISEGAPYTGFLYVGLMIAPDGKAKVLEYNCRMGDPETQPIMMRLQSDLVELCQQALAQKLDNISAEWDPRSALGVVLCAGGYPDAYLKGDIISGLEEAGGLDGKVFHAGTVVKDNHVVTNGGRVLCATCLGETTTLAQQKAYQLAKAIDWNGVFYRSDIGYRAIAREQR